MTEIKDSQETKDKLLPQEARWELKISILNITLSKNKKSYSYSYKDIIAIDKIKENKDLYSVKLTFSNNKYSQIFAVNENNNVILKNFLSKEATNLVNLFKKYQNKINKLKELILNILEWHNGLIKTSDIIFKRLGFLSFSTQEQEIKPIFEHKPQDKDNLFADKDIKKLLELTQKDFSKNQKHALNAYNQDYKKFCKLYNEYFTSQIINNNKLFFDKIEKSPLTGEQCRAVVNLNDRVLLNASAGSGKTSTLIAKVAYLTMFNICNPDEILILSFNAKTVEEISARLNTRLGNFIPNIANIVKVKTFHAFGRELIHYFTGKYPHVAPYLNSNDAAQSTYFKNFIDSLYDASAIFRRRLFIFKEVLNNYLYVDEEHNLTLHAKAIEKIFYTLNLNQTMYGSSIKSFQQDDKKIHVINLIEDKVIVLGTTKYKTTKTVLAYFTTEECKNFLYLKKLPQLIRKGFQDLIQKDSLTHPLQLLDKYLLKRFKKNDLLDQFSSLMQTFFCLSKNSLKSPTLLLNLVNKHDSEFSLRDKSFLYLFKFFYEKWVKHLNGNIDFEDMLHLSTNLIEQNKIILPFKYILIDECQDFSLSRARLVQTVLKYTPAKLFAVGDDWQSINRFSGSELTIMTEFEKYFGKFDLLKLEQTFRCSQDLCNISSNFIQKNHIQLKKNVKAVNNYNEKTPVKIIEQNNPLESKYALRKTIEKIIQDHSNQPLSIFYLDVITKIKN